MHSCLCITEILEEIFEHAFAAKYGSSTLAVLARTCRVFSEPALDILWRKQTSLIPLLKCLPQDLWILCWGTKYENFREAWALTRDIVREDWVSVRPYARRIKIFEHGPPRESDRCMIQSKTLLRLLDTCPMSLLPNVTQLSYATAFISPWWYEYDATFVPCLVRLLNKNLAQITLDIHSDIMREEVDVMMADICLQCPRTSMFYLGLERSSLFSMFNFTDRLGSLRHLHTLEIDFLEGKPDITALPKNSQQDLFPSLRKFGLTVNCAEYAFPLIENIGSSDLETININIRGPLTAFSLHILFMTFRCNTPWLSSLRSVTLHAKEDTVHDIPPSTTQLLTVFSKLRSVCFLNIGIVLNDDLASKMAKAWPDLEQLAIQNPLQKQDPSNLSLTGLAALAAGCPKLSLLQFKLDARDIPDYVIPRNPLDPVEVSKGIMRLVLSQGSQIDDQSEVTPFLLLLFPKLRVWYLGLEKEELYARWSDVTKQTRLSLT
ncbi:hypothetical protein SERLA73DRAFT_188726 [Serpula lacrymans var. lacrymans S7.3]|uniref:F-box domain-containing protein n=2 Tax=Serpula lacrymans var. lacrymans TaxID=341189 RepID=F8QC12_SERL3|nr:uncharacterized protein SERLADRAFT_479131 [Serpula lacrymans var. lacrymans S7.9]EGN94131.1 hypothetical protein SERLA73DRAFT_188726 [Serpula lacrymans var. lacrymans S7.3]EGO19565.1 hypothetical protein SERLADRAFT_479131 [Serpula lacrymans var. lacrymans S7.9]